MKNLGTNLMKRDFMGEHRALPCGSGFTREEAGPAGQYPWPFTVAATTVFAGEPDPTLTVPHTHRWCGTGRCRSGFIREEAGPAGQYPWSFTVATTTVFAGEPAPTLIGAAYTSLVVAQAVVGAGSPAKGPGLLANTLGHSPSCDHTRH